MNDTKEEWEEKFDNTIVKEQLSLYIGGEPMPMRGIVEPIKTFIRSLLTAERERVAEDLIAMCNRIKTDNGFARALSNYIVKLKSPKG